MFQLVYFDGLSPVEIGRRVGRAADVIRLELIEIMRLLRDQSGDRTH